MLGGSLADQASLNIFPDAELFGIPIGARARNVSNVLLNEGAEERSCNPC